MTQAYSEVIDWQEAMQQCGDDEEFLRELLSDLRSEMQTQLTNISATIQVGISLSLSWVGRIYRRVGCLVATIRPKADSWEKKYHFSVDSLC